MSNQEKDSSEPKDTVKLKKRSFVCENSRWRVSLDHISNSDGLEVPDYMVIHPKTAHNNLISGICVLPIYNEKIGLVSYFRHPVEEIFWEAPRGFIDVGEKPEDAAIRELGEETGLVCNPDNLIFLGYYLPEPSTIRARGVLFAAQSCQLGSNTQQQELGLGKLSFFSTDEVLEMISSSKIQDASSLITCYRYYHRMIREQPKGLEWEQPEA